MTVRSCDLGLKLVDYGPFRVVLGLNWGILVRIDDLDLKRPSRTVIYQFGPVVTKTDRDPTIRTPSHQNGPQFINPEPKPSKRTNHVNFQFGPQAPKTDRELPIWILNHKNGPLGILCWFN